MKLQQLRYLLQVVKSGMSVSKAARTLHTSQSGVSRYLRMLETELGADLFVREDRRLVRLTAVGEAILEVAKRMLSDAEVLRRIGRDFRSGEHAELTIATAQTHVRYTLPWIFEHYARRFPRGGLRLRQGYVRETTKWTVDGEADVFIGGAPESPMPELSLLPSHELHRVIVVPPKHPLLRHTRPTLDDLTRFPIITNDQEIANQREIVGAFHRRNLAPNVVLSTTDADIMKTYVRLGAGIAIMAHVAFDRRSDHGLRAIDAAHLFDSHMVYLGHRTNAFLSPQMRYFIELFMSRDWNKH